MLTAPQVLSLCCDLYKNESQSLSKTFLDNGEAAGAVAGDEEIPNSESCCLLRIVDYEVDVMNGGVHPIYEFIEKGRPGATTATAIATAATTFWPSDHDDDDQELPDFSNINFPKVIWTVVDDWEVAVKTLGLLPLVIISLLGNAIVIRVILKARLTRNPVNLFILNMSIADLLNALTFPWIFLVLDFYQKFVLGSFICRFEAVILTTLLLTSVLSLTVISYDRLMAVLFPFRNRMKPRGAKIIIYCIWLVSFAASVPIIIWREFKERPWKDFLETYCYENPTMRTYWLLLLIFSVWFPLAILILSYSAIVFKLDTLEKRQGDHPLKQIKCKSRVVRMFFVVVIVFNICWIPYTVFTVIRNQLAASSQQNSQSFKDLSFVANYFMFMNSAINPIIYGLKNDNLKRELRTAMPACFKRKRRVNISTVERYNNKHDEHGLGQQQHQQRRRGGLRGSPSGGDGTSNQIDKIDRNEFPSSTGTKFTKMFAKSAETDEKSLFSSNERGAASLSSYERRNSALEDLGLPVPTFTSNSNFDEEWSLPN